MLSNWLQPLSPEVRKSLATALGSLGSVVLHYQANQALPAAVQVAFIGLNATEANELRKALYALQIPGLELMLLDLGNLRNENPDFLIPILSELLKAGVLPILAGRDPAWIRAQYRAHRELQGAVNLAVVDERLAYNPASEPPDYLHGILEHPEADLFHLSLLAAQVPFLPGEHLALLEKRFHTSMRLGEIRADISEAEPLLRDADTLAVHLRAIKFSDAPGVADQTPNGLQAEEACQLMRYAGLSDKLRALGMYGLSSDLDQRGQTVQLTAQMIWYFLEGYAMRFSDFPVSPEGMTEYITDTQDGLHLSFWKSIRSGRWWIQAPEQSREGLLRHRLIPCTYADYLAASQGDIPDRLLQAFRRYEL